MTGDKDLPDSLDEIFRKSLEMLRQPLPAGMREASPFEGLLNDAGSRQSPPKQPAQGAGLLHGLAGTDDAAFKAWLIHEIAMLTVQTNDDYDAIIAGAAKLEERMLRRIRLGKLREAFETLLDAIVTTEDT